MRITTLCDNSTSMRRGLLAEHGFSVLLEGTERVLFDTGQTDVAVRNADTMGVDLATLTKIVLSHGHCDHTGGLRAVLERCGPVDVVAHPDIFQSKWFRDGDSSAFVGVPFAREELESLGARFVLSRDPVKISDEMTTTGEIPRSVNFESSDEGLYIKTAAGWISDLVKDDLALILEQPTGTAVILGCCHAGLINTLEQVRRVVGDGRLELILGGTHLGFTSLDEKRLSRTLGLLEGYDPNRIGVSHCTGFLPSMRFAESFGSRFFRNAAGVVTTFDQ